MKRIREGKASRLPGRLVVGLSSAEGALAGRYRIERLVLVIAAERLGLAEAAVRALMFPRVNFQFVVLEMIMLASQ